MHKEEHGAKGVRGHFPNGFHHKWGLKHVTPITINPLMHVSSQSSQFAHGWSERVLNDGMA